MLFFIVFNEPVNDGAPLQDWMGGGFAAKRTVHVEYSFTLHVMKTP